MAKIKNKCVIVIEDREDKDGQPSVALSIDYAGRTLPENETEYTMAEEIGAFLLGQITGLARSVEYVDDTSTVLPKGSDPDGRLN